MKGATWVTPAQFDSTRLLATTEFVQRALGSYAGLVTYPGSTALTAEDVGKWVNPSGAATITLPDASGVVTMANDLRLRVLLDAIDKASAPLKQISKGSLETARELKAARDRLKELNAQQKDVSAWRTQLTQAQGTTRALEAARAKVRAVAQEMAATGAPTKAMTSNMRAAVREAQRLKTEHQQQAEKLQQLRTKLSSASVANAERLVGIINYEIQAGTFSYARHFPNSPRVKSNTFGHFIDLWLDIKRNEMASSGFLAYQSKVENHIRPMWGERQADQIDHLDLQTWIQKTLMPKLHNKTVREILSIVRQVFTLYRTRNKTAHNPTEGITVRLPDADDPDPFERSEIDLILGDDQDFQQEVNLIKFIIWTGPRVSEAMSLAWEDVDLEAGTVKFRRSQVRSDYRVTKTRRSTREVRLLKPALEALRAQVRFTKGRSPVDVDVTDRDNRTVKRQKLRFVFHKTTTDAAWTSSDVLVKTWWRSHLEKVGVRYRGPNNCRHTFASQTLSTGVVPMDWIADQMGHTSTAMIWKHYGKWIHQDGPDMVAVLEHALRL